METRAMIRLALIAALSLAVTFAWIYGAMRTAERIARAQQKQIHAIESNQ